MRATRIGILFCATALVWPMSAQANWLSRFFGAPGGYNECMLQRLKGQNLALAKLAAASCRDDFPCPSGTHWEGDNPTNCIHTPTEQELQASAQAAADERAQAAADADAQAAATHYWCTHRQDPDIHVRYVCN